MLAARLLPRGRPGRRGQVDVAGVALLGGGVLALMLPLVQAESGGLARLWWLFAVGLALLAAFALWERRVVRRGGEPLLDPRLITQTPGYATGAALGTVYFIGFSGIWLVFALFFQTGLGWTPLQSGLAVTPFALGSAVSAVFGGRLVDRYGRRLTVIGLTGVLVGIGAAAVVLRFAPAGSVGWAVAPALLLGGLGGGLVISPNVTMTLHDVPVRMAGSAGGALQTGQRFGAAIGTATLPALFYLVLSSTGNDFRAAIAAALATAVVGVAAGAGDRGGRVAARGAPGTRRRGHGRRIAQRTDRRRVRRRTEAAFVHHPAARGARDAEGVAEELHLQQEQVLRHHLLRRHVRDPGQRQHAVRAAAGEQRRRQPERVGGDDVVVGEAVHQQQRAGQLRGVREQRGPRVGVGMGVGTAQVALGVVGVVQGPVGDRRAGDGGVEDVRAAQHGQRREVAPEGPPADAHAGQVEVGPAGRERVQRVDLVVQHRPGEIAAHRTLERRAASRGAPAVDDDDGEALLGEPLAGQVRAARGDDALGVRAAVGVHEHRQRRPRLVPRREQQRGAQRPLAGTVQA